MIWSKLTIEVVPPATEYGHIIDYLYAVNRFQRVGEMGRNVARRRKWWMVPNLYLYARELTEEETDTELRLSHGVFLAHIHGGEIEFKPSDEDMQATDWQISTRV